MKIDIFDLLLQAKTLHACRKKQVESVCERMKPTVHDAETHVMTFIEFNESSVKNRVCFNVVRNLYTFELILFDSLYRWKNYSGSNSSSWVAWRQRKQRPFCKCIQHLRRKFFNQFYLLFFFIDFFAVWLKRTIDVTLWKRENSCW